MTAKAQFLASNESASEWRGFAQSILFDVACTAALMTLIEQAEDGQTPEQAAAHHHRVMGAKQFRDILKTLGDQQIPLPPPVTIPELNQNL